jgi:hypothetical protein
MTLSIIGLFVTLAKHSLNDAQHINTAIMLSVFMLRVAIYILEMLNVVMLSVMAPLIYPLIFVVP